MAEIILSRAEFLVLLDVMQASAVVGIDEQTLIPASIDNHRQVVEQGQQMLQERDLLQILPDGTRAISELLLFIARVMARPEFALLNERETPEIGRQLFIHYVVADYVVEQTFPVEGQHRLATLPNVEALFDRLLAIFPVSDASPNNATGELAQEDFLAAKADAEEGRNDQAQAIFVRAGFSDDAATLLVDSFAEPAFGGTVALLRCANEEIIEARNPAIVQGPHAAWSIAQIVPGEPRFRIARVDAVQLRAQLVGWFNELKHVPNPAQ